MKIYAEILGNKVRHIFQVPDDFTPEFAPPMEAIEITNIVPRPQEGWTYTNNTFAQPQVPKCLYIHTTVSGSDGLIPPGIVNDNTETITLIGSIRNTVDPLSTITSSINGIWRITIRNTSGLIYDIIKVNVVDGRFSVAYKTDNKPDECVILESDFDKVTLNNTEYTMKLVNPITFKVYKDL